MPSILITQCLQNDLVQPIGRYDEVPCLLHVGHAEARRLMGENPSEGPVGMTMRWAYSQAPGDLHLIHVRDWHTAERLEQSEHLRHFGTHCMAGTHGAEFAFPIPDPDRPVQVIDSCGMNDFIGTQFASILAPFSEEPVRVGLMGVWTEAKVFFLTYEILSRYPQVELAVCSALTASSSKANHVFSLTQMERLLRVRVLHSIGQFMEFLGGGSLAVPLPGLPDAEFPRITMEGQNEVGKTDMHLLRYLFRDAATVRLKALAGGYSGNLVLSSASTDLQGHEQVPHVIKIGDQEEIGEERTSFEQIESVLGNNAPRIVEFADYRGRGGLKYRYAAMSGTGASTTLKKLYSEGLSEERIRDILHSVFVEQMGRLYAANREEERNLLGYYRIEPGYAPRMRQKVEQVLGTPATDPELSLPAGETFPNPATFYSRDLAGLLPRARASVRFADVHGDLNASNIIIDGHENVWLIDFALTHYGHVLRDFIKLENDLMFILTPVECADDLSAATKLTDALMAVRDLSRPLPEPEQVGITHPAMLRTYNTIRTLRSHYRQFIGNDRNVLQLLIGQLWYSGRTLSYVESNRWQKQWALYAAGYAAEGVRKLLRAHGPLRVDWLDEELTLPGKLGLTILPGRRDRGRSLTDDIAAIRAQGVTHVVSLLTANEFTDHGVEGLIEAYLDAGLQVRVSPMLDGGVTSVAEMQELLSWISTALAEGGRVMVHCLGGLGRSGLVAASLLIARGMGAAKAIRTVRRCRSPKAIETARQEAFLQRFEAIVRADGGDGEHERIFETMDDVLDFAIGETEAAMAFYRNVAGLTRDPRVRQLFLRFVDEEEGHRKELRTIQTQGTLESLEHRLVELETDLQAGRRPKLGSVSAAELGYEEALRLAMEKEKTSFRLYLKLAECTSDPPTKAILLAFAEDDARHRMQFEVELEEFTALQREVAEMRAQMQSGSGLEQTEETTP